MPIEMSKTRVDPDESSFPAYEDSIFPNKSTVRIIIYSTVIIALFGALLGFANRSVNRVDFSTQPTMRQPEIREAAPNPGAHDQ
jgi:hypothetical protein